MTQVIYKHYVGLVIIITTTEGLTKEAITSHRPQWIIYLLGYF